MQIVTDLAEYKEQHKLSYSELGKLLGVSKKVCYDTLTGKRRFIGLDTLQKAQLLLQPKGR